MALLNSMCSFRVLAVVAAATAAVVRGSLPIMVAGEESDAATAHANTSEENKALKQEVLDLRQALNVADIAAAEAIRNATIETQREKNATAVQERLHHEFKQEVVEYQKAEKAVSAAQHNASAQAARWQHVEAQLAAVKEEAAKEQKRQDEIVHQLRFALNASEANSKAVEEKRLEEQAKVDALREELRKERVQEKDVEGALASVNRSSSGEARHLEHVLKELEATRQRLEEANVRVDELQSALDHSPSGGSSGTTWLPAPRLPHEQIIVLVAFILGVCSIVGSTPYVLGFNAIVGALVGGFMLVVCGDCLWRSHFGHVGSPYGISLAHSVSELVYGEGLFVEYFIWGFALVIGFTRWALDIDLRLCVFVNEVDLERPVEPQIRQQALQRPLLPEDFRDPQCQSLMRASWRGAANNNSNSNHAAHLPKMLEPNGK